jgi:hypothetical protein
VNGDFKTLVRLLARVADIHLPDDTTEANFMESLRGLLHHMGKKNGGLGVGPNPGAGPTLMSTGGGRAVAGYLGPRARGRLAARRQAAAGQPAPDRQFLAEQLRLIGQEPAAAELSTGVPANPLAGKVVSAPPGATAAAYAGGLDAAALAGSRYTAWPPRRPA